MLLYKNDRGAFFISKYVDVFRYKRNILKGKNAEGLEYLNILSLVVLVNSRMTVVFFDGELSED